jgi:hypothetical protein
MATVSNGAFDSKSETSCDSGIQDVLIAAVTSDPLCYFPLEVVEHIFSFLDGFELAKLRLVSKLWSCTIQNSQFLWKSIHDPEQIL